MRSINRRTFFIQSAGIGLSLAASKVRAKCLNERLNVGFIGLGGRGKELLSHFGNLPDVRIAALCDADRQNLSRVGDSHRGVKTYVDLRELIDDADIDAVAVATCNHWHALATIWACSAGKDVYVEKPLSHSHWEGQQVVRAARKYDRIVQVGIQQRSDPLQTEIKDYLHSQQALGAIQHVQVCRFGRREPIGKRTSPLQPPKSLDYNLWLGPASDQPIHRNKLEYDWHWDWNTGNGELGNWGVHVLDDAVNVVLQDRVAFPKAITAAGGRVLWDDAGQTPNVCFACYDTGSTPIFFALSNLADRLGRDGASFNGLGSGYIVRCDGGYYVGARGIGAAYDDDGSLIRRFAGDAGTGHARNFVDAVCARDRNLLNAEVELGHQSTAWCNLADISVRVGRPYDHATAAASGRPLDAWNSAVDAIEQHLAKHEIDTAKQLKLSPWLDFDGTVERFVGPHADEANALLRREYRPPFELPAMA